jgi:hypothetical protein
MTGITVGGSRSEAAIASAVISPAAHQGTSAGPSGERQPASGGDRSGKRRVRGKVPRSKRLDLRVSEEELIELRRLAKERGISIQRMLVDDVLTRRTSRGQAGGLNGVVIDDLVGELMRLRGDLGRAGNAANQAVRDARRLDSQTQQAMRLNEALEAVNEIAAVAVRVRQTAMSLGRLR